jgi:hypothetical protein
LVARVGVVVVVLSAFGSRSGLWQVFDLVSDFRVRNTVLLVSAAACDARSGRRSVRAVR